MEKGQNLVVEDSHRSTAIEIFENYFARAYKRKEGSMTKKRFMKRIENAQKREEFDGNYLDKFTQLFADARKDEKGRVSSEDLIDAIVIMIKREDESQNS